LSLSHVRKRSFIGPEFTKFHLAARFRPDPLGELTALPRPPSCMKGGEGQEMGMKERERKGTTESKEEKRGQEKGGELGKQLKMGCVSRVVKMHYWQHIDLPPKNFLAPLWLPHSKKLAPPLVISLGLLNRLMKPKKHLWIKVVFSVIRKISNK